MTRPTVASRKTGRQDTPTLPPTKHPKMSGIKLTNLVQPGPVMGNPSGPLTGGRRQPPPYSMLAIALRHRSLSDWSSEPESVTISYAEPVYLGRGPSGTSAKKYISSDLGTIWFDFDLILIDLV